MRRTPSPSGVDRKKYDLLKEKAQRWRKAVDDLSARLTRATDTNEVLSAENEQLHAKINDVTATKEKLLLRCNNFEAEHSLRSQAHNLDDIVKQLKSNLAIAEDKAYASSRNNMRKDDQIEDLQEALLHSREKYARLKEEAKESAREAYERLREVEKDCFARLREIRTKE